MRNHNTFLRAVALGATLLLAAARPAAAAESAVLRGAVLDYPLSSSQAGDGGYDPRTLALSPVAEEQAARVMQAWQSEAASLPWTDLMLKMIAKHKVAPTRAARGSALLHVAMYDALLLAPDEATRRVAVASAATQVLGYWFTAEEHGFDRIMGSVLRRMEQRGAIAPEQLALGVKLGWRVGRRVIAKGEADGAARGWNGVSQQWYGEGRYYGPGAWQPTQPYFYYPPDEPFAPGWKTWVLKSADQFRPVPPAFGSERFLKDLQEVIDVQKNLTPEQLRLAKFWVDGSGSVTPPGHWNQIAQDLARKHKMGDADAAKVFVVLNVALADTFIAVWDAKYHYWTARPITMAKTVLGAELKTAILTPPFPSFVSGHAAFSGAAARVLGVFFPGEAGELDAMAEQAALSRLYGGIHYRFDNEAGLALGRSVAGAVLEDLGR